MNIDTDVLRSLIPCAHGIEEWDIHFDGAGDSLDDLVVGMTADWGDPESALSLLRDSLRWIFETTTARAFIQISDGDQTQVTFHGQDAVNVLGVAVSRHLLDDRNNYRLSIA